MAWRKLTITNEDGSAEELDPTRIIIITLPHNTLRELAIMDHIAQVMSGLNTDERKRILAWIADRNENVGEEER